MAELSALQRSAMDTSDKWFALDTRRGPIWGSRGREFKSRQPDQTIHPIRPSRTCIQPAFLPPSIRSNSRSGPETDQRAEEAVQERFCLGG
jgi:hypothetical protein